MYRIRLNTAIRDNNAFFCPDTRLYLTLTNPVGSADRVSPAIRRGIKSKTLIDMDGLLNAVQGDTKPEQPVQDTKNDNQEPKEPAAEDPKQEEIPSSPEPEQVPEQEQPSPEQQPSQQPEGDVFSQLEGAEAPVEPPKAEKKPAAKKASKAKTAKAAE